MKPTTKLTTKAFWVVLLLCFMYFPLEVESQTLVAHYTFNGNAQDASGNGNHGTVNGATLTSDRNGNSNGAYSFDGNNDVITYLNNQNFHPSLPVTIAAWVSVNATGIQPIFENEYRDGKYDGVWMSIINQKLTVSYGDGGSATSNNRRTATGSTVLSLNTWYHVTGVIRGANDMSLYVNGIYECDVQYSGYGGNLSYSGNDGISGLNTSASTSYLNGKIDEIWLYDGELSQGDIAQLAGMALSNGLVAHYPFDGDALDHSGNGNNGTLNGGATYTTDRLGNSNSAIELDGSNDYISLTSNSNFRPNRPATVTAWIYFQSNNSNNIFQNDYQVGSYNGIILNIANGKLSASIGNGGGTNSYGRRTCTGTTQLNQNTWYHVAAIYNADNTFDLYINGQVECCTPSGYATTMNYSTGNVGDIGRSASTPVSYYDGKIDDIHLYNRALTVNEIRVLAWESRCIPIGCGVGTRQGNNSPLNPSFLTLYPNPNDGIFDIEISELRFTKLEIFNVSGQLIWADEMKDLYQKRINISHLKPGVYVLRATSGNLSDIQKLMIY